MAKTLTDPQRALLAHAEKLAAAVEDLDPDMSRTLLELCVLVHVVAQ